MMERLYSMSEAASLLGMTVHQLGYALRRDGAPAIRMVGGYRIFSDADIEAIRRWMATKQE